MAGVLARLACLLVGHQPIPPSPFRGESILSAVDDRPIRLRPCRRCHALIWQTHGDDVPMRPDPNPPTSTS